MVSVQECGNASVLESSFARGEPEPNFLTNQRVLVVATLDMQEVMDPALAVEL